MTDPRFLAHVPPAPRAISAAGSEVVAAYGKMRRWVGVFFLGHGAVMTTVFSWGLPVDIAVDLSGAHVDARITEVDRATSVKLNKKRATKISYSYTVGGETLTGSFHTIDPKLTAAVVGGRLPLEYFPTIPSWARASGQRNCFFGYFGGLLAIEPLLGLPLLASGVLARRRARAVWTSGSPVPASVTSVTVGRVRRKNGRTRERSAKIAWSYAYGPSAMTGGIDTESATLKLLRQGDPFTLLVAPNDPSFGVPWVGEGQSLVRS